MKFRKEAYLIENLEVEKNKVSTPYTVECLDEDKVLHLFQIKKKKKKEEKDRINVVTLDSPVVNVTTSCGHVTTMY